MGDMERYLAHFGITGQKWGVRRFQNPDGTFTEEGKRRYYDTLTDRQKKIYDKFSEKNRQRIEEKMGEGKSFSKAAQETVDRQRKVNNLKLATAAGATYAAYLLVTFPQLRQALKAGLMKKTIDVLKSDVVRRNAQKIGKFMKRNAMKKAGAIVLNKKDYKIFGNYLGT